MLAIRMQRTGRKGQAHFRLIVQDSHRSPSTGKVIEYLGSYDPHTKKAQLDKEKIEKFMNNGAQPSNRVALLLEKEGYKLPKWVNVDKSGKKQLKNPEKLRKNQPDEPAPAVEETPVEEAEEVVEEDVAEVVEEKAEEEVAEVVEEAVEEEAKEEVQEEEVKEAKAEKTEKKKEEK